MHLSCEPLNFQVYIISVDVSARHRSFVLIGCPGSLIGLLDAQVPKVLAGLVHSRCYIYDYMIYRRNYGIM